MRAAILSAVGVSLFLAGCSNISRLDVPPDLEARDGKYRPSVESITQRIRCELAPLADKNRDFNLAYGNWVAVVQLTLDVVDDGSLVPSFLYTDKMFSFNVGAKLEASREHNVVIDLVYPIRSIQDSINRERIAAADGSKALSRFSCPTIIDTNLAGELSITETAEMAIKAQDLNYKISTTANSGTFGGFVQFIVTKNLNSVGPTWTLKHFKGPGNFAGVSEVNTDKVVFAFAQEDPAEKDKATAKAADAAKAYITNININQITVDFSSVRSNTF